MRRFLITVTLMLASTAACYLAAAFVMADIRWLHDIWTWSPYERFWLLYGGICSSLPGTMVATVVR
jgi:hypothetical protein